jgi:hypothetical protein
MACPPAASSKRSGPGWSPLFRKEDGTLFNDRRRQAAMTVRVRAWMRLVAGVGEDLVNGLLRGS